MVSCSPVIDDDGEVGDLSEFDPALFKPLHELPASLQAKLRGQPKEAPPLVQSLDVAPHQQQQPS